MRAPTLLRDRGSREQIILAGLVPFVLGAIVGVMLGVSSGGYWALSALAALGGVLAGLEHQSLGGGARRGLVGGALFAAGLLIAHAAAGTDAKVSLGSFPPLLIVIDAVIGMILSSFGSRLRKA